MVEGLYSAAAGMAAQQTRLDAISNDIANLDTTGYEAQRVGFRDLLYSSTGPGNGAGVAVGAGAATETLGTSQVAGALQQTGRSLDVAINGPGYLEVRSGTTTGLTRDGALQLDSRGQLTTADGAIVQPPITVPTGVNESALSIGSDGTVRANGKTLGRIALVTVPAPDQLTPSGNSTYSTGAATGAIRPAVGATLTSGALEGSNVDLNSEMVEMMDAQRSYALDSQAINIQQQMMQTANEVKQ